MMEVCVEYIIRDTNDPVLKEKLRIYLNEKKGTIYQNAAIESTREKILKIVPEEYNVSPIDYKTRCFNIMFPPNLPKRAIPRGMSINISNQGKNITYNVAILDESENIIFDESIGYVDVNIFYSFESLCDELIRIVYLPAM